MITPAIAADTKVTTTGSSTIAPLAAEPAKGYEEKHQGVRIDVQSDGSSRGITDARSGLADNGMASRAHHEEEKDLKGFVIARIRECDARTPDGIPSTAGGAPPPDD